MGLFDKLFSGKHEDKDEVILSFGRYSDNNKTAVQQRIWQDAKKMHAEKQYMDSIELFFAYLLDARTKNVHFKRNGNSATFCLYQGSKKVEGTIDEQGMRASTPIATMTKRRVPVLRSLLENNYRLHYSKYYLEGDCICLHIYNDIYACTPTKLYFSLKELALNADKMDDILVDDFDTLTALGTDHIVLPSDEEKKIKYQFFTKWLDETIAKIESLNADTFSGANTYLILNLLFKLDYLLLPEGKLTEALEEVNSIFWRNRESMQATERNLLMLRELKKIRAWKEEEVCSYFYKTKHTFAITKPTEFGNIVNFITDTVKNSAWYQENDYDDITLELLEYALAYGQFSFSLPQPLSQLFNIIMQVNHSDYYLAMGQKLVLYNEEINSFNKEEITKQIQMIMDENADRYESVLVEITALDFSNRISFILSLLQQIVNLDFRKKK